MEFELVIGLGNAAIGFIAISYGLKPLGITAPVVGDVEICLSHSSNSRACESDVESMLGGAELGGRERMVQSRQNEHDEGLVQAAYAPPGAIGEPLCWLHPGHRQESPQVHAEGKTPGTCHASDPDCAPGATFRCTGG